MTAGAFLRSHKQPGGVLVSLARGGGGLGVMVNKSSSTANLVMVGFPLLGTGLAAVEAAWSCCRRCCPGLGGKYTECA